MTFKNIEALVLNGFGEISIGRVGPVKCVATAVNEDECLAMLVRKPEESFGDLLARLDSAIEDALEREIFLDEINE